jgi:hypothetical protein
LGGNGSNEQEEDEGEKECAVHIGYFFNWSMRRCVISYGVWAELAMKIIGN